MGVPLKYDPPPDDSLALGKLVEAVVMVFKADNIVRHVKGYPPGEPNASQVADAIDAAYRLGRRTENGIRPEQGR